MPCYIFQRALEVFELKTKPSFLNQKQSKLLIGFRSDMKNSFIIYENQIRTYQAKNKNLIYRWIQPFQKENRVKQSNIKEQRSNYVILTFSGRVSTLNRIRPRQSRRTTARDEDKTVIGFLATYDPYFLIHICKHEVRYCSM